MLTQDQANSQLNEFKNHSIDTAVIKIALLLKPQLLSIGHFLVSYHKDAGKYTKADIVEHAQAIDDLSVTDRTKLFSALFPQMGDLVEDAWQLHQTLPYQTQGTRRGFRAPKHAKLTQDIRMQWLFNLLETTVLYDQPIEWFAQWAAYIKHPDYNWLELSRHLSYVFAAAINKGNQSVLDILKDSASGTHPIGAMGRHIARALLVCNNSQAWDFIEKLLIAAQRQEGLRQLILETVDEAHPQAFIRMLKLIQTEKLTRFASVVRAVDVWFGFQHETGDDKALQHVLLQTNTFLESKLARHTALQSDQAQDIYLALWVEAFDDAVAAIDIAKPLLTHNLAEVRYVAVHFLIELKLNLAYAPLASLLDDPDIRVQTLVLNGFNWYFIDEQVLKHVPNLFERLETVLQTIPAKFKVPKIVWSWTEHTFDRTRVPRILQACLSTRPVQRLFPYIPMMDPYQRASIVDLLLKHFQTSGHLDTESKSLVFQLLSDTSANVRESTLKFLNQLTLSNAEVEQFEPLLKRKAADLRRGVIGLILKLDDAAAIASAKRLLAGDAATQQAGIEILRELKQAKRSESSINAVIQHLPVDIEADDLRSLNHSEQENLSLENGLGLYNPHERTPIITPQNFNKGLVFNRNGRQFTSPTSLNIVESLEALVHKHRETLVPTIRWTEDDIEEELLGNIKGVFWHPNSKIAEIPLRDVWDTWWESRPKNMRDEDGFETLRTVLCLKSKSNYHGRLQVIPSVSEHINYTFQYESIIVTVIEWLLLKQFNTSHIDYLLDGAETSIEIFPKTIFHDAKHDYLERSKTYNYFFYQDPREQDNPNKVFLNILNRRLFTLLDDKIRSTFTQQQFHRLWSLLRTYDEGFKEAPRYRFSIHSFLPIWEMGCAKDEDVYDYLIGVRCGLQNTNNSNLNHLSNSFNELRELSKYNHTKNLTAESKLKHIIQRITSKILSIELKRGDLPTIVSEPAKALRSIYGASYVFQILKNLGKDKLIRGYSYDGASKSAVFSSLLRVSFPSAGDTFDSFAAEAKAAKLTEQRLIDLAMYAPQWSKYVESSIACPSFADAVFWFHAHTKDVGWNVDNDVREVWATEIAERTPLGTQNLIDGAVDVTWFKEVYQAMGPDRWAQLHQSALYSSSSGGHKRAQLFAQALLGLEPRAELEKRIQDKRHQDAIRALGLLPLSSDAKQQRADVLSRYTIIQRYIRDSKQFGSQRQASEKLAADIAMENLARTAGYQDPQRLMWAMEALEIADLSQGPITKTIDDVTISLFITALGEVELSISKQGKQLKDIPATLKKNAEIVALRERKNQLNKQTSRMRLSLEEAMIRGDQFSVTELVDLFQHPVLKPMIEALLVVTDQGELGYLCEQGTALKTLSDTLHLESERLRIAHPHDLFLSKQWHLHQQLCFGEQRQQPFKQIFRELYIITPAELDSKTGSARYQGHQLNSGVAHGVIGKRGWVAVREEGIRKTFHADNLSVHIEFSGGYYTPAEVDGLTIDSIVFTRRAEYTPVKLSDISPRIFSEVMRDIDLMVSVAHRGGVDPEASASTIEMRTRLLEETLQLLKLNNVRIEKNHAFIKGHLSDYTVHLGSAIVHRQPGGFVCMIPVHSQHRGRLFLPFADNDPKTAELMSKVIMLAEDKKIKDPSILEQLR